MPTARAVLAGAMALMTVVGCTRLGGDDPPHVVFILVDTLRADHLPSYGYEHGSTPVIDRLAAEGVLFERVIAPSSWTKTSMASILTSRNADRHGVRGVDDTLPDELVTLAEAFAAGGRQTLGVNTNPWLEAKFGFDVGFDSYENQRRPSDVTVKLPFAPAADVNRLALAAVDAAERRPSLLYVHYMDAHAPYVPEPAYFDEPPLTIPGRGPMADASLEFDYRKRGLGGPGVQERIVRLYDAGITAVDAAIGELLDGLTAARWLENTIIVLTSDHGEAFREHGTTEHGRNLYPEVYEVPLIIVWPGHVAGGSRIAAQVRAIDVAPTVVELAGLPVPSSFEGESLLPLGGSHTDRIAIANVGLNDYLPAHDYVAVVSPTHLFVKERRRDVVEFYDLRTDPRASRNLGASHPAAASYAELESHADAPDSAKAALDQDTTTRLKALGYLDDE